MSIYKPCDIRGGAATELSPELYHAWGRALGCQVSPGDKFIVGGDVRASTPEFLDALTDGLCQAGANVVDLGVVPTAANAHHPSNHVPTAIPSPTPRVRSIAERIREPSLPSDGR